MGFRLPALWICSPGVEATDSLSRAVTYISKVQLQKGPCFLRTGSSEPACRPVWRTVTGHESTDACSARGHDVFGAPFPTYVLTPSGGETTRVAIRLSGDAFSLSFALSLARIALQSSGLSCADQVGWFGPMSREICFTACKRPAVRRHCSMMSEDVGRSWSMGEGRTAAGP